MISFLTNRIRWIVLLGVVLCSFTSPLSAITYSVTDLGVLPGGSSSSATGINTSGQVVGNCYTPDGRKAFLWTSGSGMQDLGVLPGGSSSNAYGINTSGQIVGDCYAPNGERAFLWTSGSGMQDLGVTPLGDSCSTGINASGQVVGWYNSNTVSKASLWTSGSGMQDLGVLPGGTTSGAHGINASGQVVGWSGFWDQSSRTPLLIKRAFLWTSGSGMQDLGVLPGYLFRSDAYGINTSGQVVGSCDVTTGPRAFVWTSGSGMQDINNLLDASGNGWSLSEARAINDNGQICGTGTYNGMTRAFLLTPVPEPSAFLLLAAAGGCAFVWNRRRARHAK